MPDDALQSTDDDAIVCRQCGSLLTRQIEAVAPNGSHEHAFFNPSGIAFELRCFRSAPGVTAQGMPVAEFTWFRGYRWQVVLCSRCATHSGWRFLSAQDVFYALIRSKLR